MLRSHDLDAHYAKQLKAGLCRKVEKGQKCENGAACKFTHDKKKYFATVKAEKMVASKKEAATMKQIKG